MVVDPVMVATSGAPLLRPEAMQVLTRRLLPRATLITPNLPEAELLVGRRLQEVEDLREAARTLRQRYGCAVLIKGGHLGRVESALDLFYDGEQELLLEAPRIAGRHTHGTGCTYAAAITACLARGDSLVRAVQRAKTFVTRAIAGAYRAARHDVLLPGA